MATSTKAIADLLDRSAEYPRADGSVGFTYSSAELTELLAESSKHIAVGVLVDYHSPDGDSTSVRVIVYATYARSELTS